jgi:hypothetical protein
MRVGSWGWLIALSVALGGGCGGSNVESAPSDFQRGEAADHRLRVCRDYILRGFSAEESLGLALSAAPKALGPGVDCVLDAESCEEVVACEDSFESARITDLPECDGPSSTRCDGDVLKRCTTNDDVTWHEISFDCTLARASCQEGINEGSLNPGLAWIDCVRSSDLCAGVGSHCDGARAIVCREDAATGLVNPAIYDCSDVFGSTCVELDEDRVDCEGPAVGEVQCGDGVDNDEDGAPDCDDPECEGSEGCFEPQAM